MKEEEGRWVTIVETFNVVKKRMKELNTSSPRSRRIRKALRRHWKGWRGRLRLSASNSARLRMRWLLLGSKSSC